ncbi:MAG: hypothetical protein RL011_2109 [Pseudomonadota bacterium]
MTLGGMTSGLEVLASNPKSAASWGRCGLLSNQASVTTTFVPSWRVVSELLDRRLVALFGPQHGFAGVVQDNMIETGHARHQPSGLPIYSLYSETRQPTVEMMRGLDTLIIDLQIVGCRIYTWKSTIAACLRAAKRDGKHIVVLDRPNPVGGELLEGRVLDDDAHWFVGEFPIPMRHGLTAGEAALVFNEDIGASLEIIPMAHWQPESYWSHLARPWVLTSPNLPTPDPVYVYPGTVMLEGTNLSEGRGTGLPFQLIGAPYISSSIGFIKRIHDLIGRPPGVHLREASFQPTSQKWAGQECQGLQIHVTDPAKVRSYQLTLAIIKAAWDVGGGGFAWQKPPYEYDYVTTPIKLIVGSHKVTEHLNADRFDPMDPFWSHGISAYIKKAEKHLLYRRSLRLAD